MKCDKPPPQEDGWEPPRPSPASFEPEEIKECGVYSMENALLLPPHHTTFASTEKQTTRKPKPQSLVQQGAPRFYLSLIYAAFLQLCPLGCDRAFAEPGAILPA